jgi:murein DD-endopeptidase MepM/ murein hydrolase activator NlpD
MPGKKLAYYYDTETCTYHRAKPSVKDYMKQIAVLAVIAVIVGFVTSEFVKRYFSDTQTVLMAQERDTLKGRIAMMHDRLDLHEERLGELLDKDNGVYLPIVGGEKISDTKWQAGAGGSELFDPNRNDVATMLWIRTQKLQHQAEVLRSSLDNVKSRMNAKEVELKNVPSIMPVNATLISGFGTRRHPITGHMKFHEGLDFACDVGTPLYATGDGVVTNDDYGQSGYGIHIDIDHGNGYQTKFAHMSQVKVHVGQRVTRGQLIGYSGNTGLSSGPHLHYEIMFKGTKIDPVDFFYMDLSPQEYRRLSLDPGKVTKEAIKKKLEAPSMD